MKHRYIVISVLIILIGNTIITATTQFGATVTSRSSIKVLKSLIVMSDYHSTQEVMYASKIFYTRSTSPGCTL